ncbi:ADP ribosylation factor interacting protein arfaptin isoform X1 [Osmia lignaria lignaria]|uniref:arfaptin-2 isoform X1 n=2 Tax=Osmia bicornis bicornis TaxID=1437191 RepID=UPI0010FA3319|nr:arfaptin-2 isoform X1 [Osmia bicornis bicornis]XP_034182058.1 arfaptin-2 isoform X1 [Osmia lignaria]
MAISPVTLSGMERSIHEMLKDAPSLNDSDSAVHSGTPPPHVPNNCTSDSQPRPATINLTLGSPTSQVSVTVSPNTPIQNGDTQTMRTAQSKIESIKNWSISTYKCTRQLMYEKLGKTSRTVDSELETQIELLRDTQKKYCNVLRLSRALASHFHHVVQTQHALGEAFSELAQKSPELQEEFLYNSETQRNLTKNGETLLGALNFFVSSVNTLCNKTIEDTLLTVRQYETARIEYDAYRTDLEALAQATKSDGSNAARLEEAQVNYEEHKQNFEKLRSDVSIKLKFLDENRIKVMHKQLLLFHNAVSAYFSGNQTALEATLKQFNIKVKSPNSSLPSWLEQ